MKRSLVILAIIGILTIIALKSNLRVDILVWDESESITCHWMPDFETCAICQEHMTASNGKTIWGEVYTDRIINEEYMYSLLAFQKIEGGWLPNCMGK